MGSQVQLVEKWIQFYETNKLVPLPSYSVTQREKSLPLCLIIHEIRNIPETQVISRLKCSHSNIDLQIPTDSRFQYRFHLSFYLKKAKKFFGNTFLSPKVSLANRSAAFDTKIFFHSSINDSSVVAVIE